MKQLIFLIIAVVLAIAATVLAFIFVVPEKRREKLNVSFVIDTLGRYRPAVHHRGTHRRSPQL